jgi:hypothetical protein
VIEDVELMKLVLAVGLVHRHAEEDLVRQERHRGTVGMQERWV